MMAHADQLGHDEIASPHRPPGVLLQPFRWAAEPLAAMVAADHSLVLDLLRISRPRMHLIGLGLAHLNWPVPPDIVPLLVRGSMRQVLDRILGHAPAGMRRVLRHLPVQVLRRGNYRQLVTLLADPDAAKVLHHAAEIDDMAIWVLGELPQPLRRPLPFALAGWPRKLNGLPDSLKFLVCRGVAANVDELVARLATVTTWPQLAAMVEFWVSMLSLPETMPPASVGKARRLDAVEKVCSLGRAWRNCLGMYALAIDDGRCAVYLWEDGERPAACLVRRHGRLGWFLDEVKGPRNSEIGPDQSAAIGSAFADVGVPWRHVVAAIENITTCGDSGGLTPTDED
jgi:hypothetical protein